MKRLAPRPDLGVAGAGALQCLSLEKGARLQAFEKHGQVDLLPAGEVGVERAPGVLGGPGDLLHAGVLDALLEEEAAGGVDDGLATKLLLLRSA